jgi:hypothetical protein
VVGNVIPFDSEAGSTYPIDNFSLGSSDIGPLLNGDYAPCIELLQADFCFIPTVSALNMTTLYETPNAPIDPVNTVANGDTPFDRVFMLDPTQYPPNTAPVNESHLALSPSNINPLENYLSVDYDPSAGINSLTTTTLNYGLNDTDPDDIKKTLDRISGAIALSGTSFPGGTICINCAGRLNIIDDTSYPINTASNFEVSLSGDCDEDWGRVTINNNGIIRVGENANQVGRIVVYDDSWIEMNDGNIEVRPGSELVIASGAELRLNGGTLRVMDGGKVIIKEGGLLRYEDGATIELNGNDAQLVLEGLTYIGNDATFGFSYTGTESGYIRLAQEGHSGERFAAGTNARIDLRGENKYDLILYLEEGADFLEYEGSVPGHSLSSFEFDRVHISDGKIMLDDDARIVLKSRAKFENCINQARF